MLHGVGLRVLFSPVNVAILFALRLACDQTFWQIINGSDLDPISSWSGLIYFFSFLFLLLLLLIFLGFERPCRPGSLLEVYALWTLSTPDRKMLNVLLLKRISFTAWCANRHEQLLCVIIKFVLWNTRFWTGAGVKILRTVTYITSHADVPALPLPPGQYYY